MYLMILISERKLGALPMSKCYGDPVHLMGNI